MAAIQGFSVTLPGMLWNHLHRQAENLGVPVELLAAGLVCDTIEALGDRRVQQPERQSRRQLRDVESARSVVSKEGLSRVATNRERLHIARPGPLPTHASPFSPASRNGYRRKVLGVSP